MKWPYRFYASGKGRQPAQQNWEHHMPKMWYIVQEILSGSFKITLFAIEFPQ